MKLMILKDVFLKAMQLVHPITTKPDKPIMENVLIKAEKDQVFFISTDGSIMMQFNVEAEVAEEGSSTFNAKLLLNVVRELPERMVSFSVDNKDVATIKCGSSSSRLYGISSVDFPQFDRVTDAVDITIDQSAFKQMIQNTVYAAALVDEGKKMLAGLFVSLRDQKLVTVATDSKRLALMEQEIQVPVGKDVDIIVPTKTVLEWVRILQDEGTVKFRASKKMVELELPSILITSKLLEETYPNYRQVIPTKCEDRAVISREGLLSALRRVSAITARGVSVKMLFSENELKITSQAPNIGDTEETLPVKYTGKEIVIKFNPNFLMEPLRNLVCDEIYFEMVDNLSPSVIKCDIPFLYVIMPQRQD